MTTLEWNRKSAGRWLSALSAIAFMSDSVSDLKNKEEEVSLWGVP
jgi:hypothetical protein